jgi:hypothetical protein
MNVWLHTGGRFRPELCIRDRLMTIAFFFAPCDDNNHHRIPPYLFPAAQRWTTGGLSLNLSWSEIQPNSFNALMSGTISPRKHEGLTFQVDPILRYYTTPSSLTFWLQPLPHERILPLYRLEPSMWLWGLATLFEPDTKGSANLHVLTQVVDTFLSFEICTLSEDDGG